MAKTIRKPLARSSMGEVTGGYLKIYCSLWDWDSERERTGKLWAYHDNEKLTFAKLEEARQWAKELGYRGIRVRSGDEDSSHRFTPRPKPTPWGPLCPEVVTKALGPKVPAEQRAGRRPLNRNYRQEE